MVLNFCGAFMCMQAAEASALSVNDSTASEEVAGAAVMKDSEAGSADLDGGGGGAKPADGAAAPPAEKGLKEGVEGESLVFFR